VTRRISSSTVGPDVGWWRARAVHINNIKRLGDEIGGFDRYPTHRIGISHDDRERRRRGDHDDGRWHGRQGGMVFGTRRLVVASRTPLAFCRRHTSSQSVWARLMRDTRDALTAHLGGSDYISETQSLAGRRTSALEAELILP
jgi:hypothetical protein